MKPEAATKPYQQQNYYQLLEVSATASEDEIRAAYERAQELYAPDSVAVYALSGAAHVDELRGLLKEAVEILTDPDLRHEYDQSIGISPPAEASESQVSHLPAKPEQEALPEAVEPTDSDPPVAPPRELPVLRGRADAEPSSAVGPHLRTTRALESAPQMAAEDAIASAETELAKVAARAKPARPKALEIPPDAEFNGELLRRVRESLGWSVQQVADRTRISSRHLENVEADRYDALPVAVYLRGILMQLAREYRLDALRVAKSYLALAALKR